MSITLALLLLLQSGTPDTIRPVWIPQRVIEGTTGRRNDFEALAEAAARADVVFFGEQHDDSNSHRMELALLEAVTRRRTDVVVSLEMIERDVQPVLDRYLTGEISEAEFLRDSRPWPNYIADYRPLVEYAKAHKWKVIAANVPRPMASLVAARGLDSLIRLRDSTRKWAAGELSCEPAGRYFDRFVFAMGGHGSPGSDAEQRNRRYYQAQCVKDETMAESIVAARGTAVGSAPLVIHYNGAFHSDYGDGTVERVRRRLPSGRLMVISAQPVADLDKVPQDEELKRGDWILLTLRPAGN